MQLKTYEYYRVPTSCAICSQSPEILIPMTIEGPDIDNLKQSILNIAYCFSINSVVLAMLPAKINAPAILSIGLCSDHMNKKDEVSNAIREYPDIDDHLKLELEKIAGHPSVEPWS